MARHFIQQFNFITNENYVKKFALRMPADNWKVRCRKFRRRSYGADSFNTMVKERGKGSATQFRLHR